MNRRKFLQALGVIAAAPAVVAKLAHHERHPAAPPEPRATGALDFSSLSQQIVQREQENMRLFQHMQWNDDMMDDDIEPYLRTQRWNAARAQGFAIDRAITG